MGTAGSRAPTELSFFMSFSIVFLVAQSQMLKDLELEVGNFFLNVSFYFSD